MRHRVRTNQLNITYGLVALILAGVGTAMMIVAHASNSDILVNVGSNLTDLVVGVAILTPIITMVTNNTVKWRVRLDLDEMILDIRQSSEAVDIAETWTRLLESRFRKAFLEAVRDAIATGVTFRIVLLDPQSPDARRRQSDVRLPVPKLIRENIAEIEALLDSEPHARERISVRVARTAPARQLYRVDTKITYAHFPTDRPSNEIRQEQANTFDDRGDLVMLWFEQLWVGSALQSLDAFLRKSVYVGDSVESDDLAYVLVGGTVWLDLSSGRSGRVSAALEAFNAGRDVRVSLDGEPYRLQRPDDLAPGVDVYRQKYRVSGEVALAVLAPAVPRQRSAQ